MSENRNKNEKPDGESCFYGIASLVFLVVILIFIGGIIDATVGPKSTENEGIAVVEVTEVVSEAESVVTESLTEPSSVVLSKGELIAKGEHVFTVNCASCHQQGGVGKAGFAPSIRNRDFLAIASDEFIRKTIIAGRPGTSTPARADLPEQDIDSIIAYLRSLEVENLQRVYVDEKVHFSGDVDKGSEAYALFMCVLSW